MPAVTFAVGFDIDHTLCIDNKLERVALLHLLEHVIASGGYALGSLHEESEHIDALLAMQRRGDFTIEEAVRRFVAERGVAPHDGFVETFKRSALDMAPSFVTPAPDAKVTLDELQRRGVPIGVLSNGWNPLQDLKARRSGFPGVVVASGDLGVQKPDSAAFAVLASVLGVAPECCYYIGDDPFADVAGAMNAGLRAVWLDNEGKTYPPGLPPAPQIVTSLAEILTILPTAIAS